MKLEEVDLTDLDRFAGGFPHEVFALLRREAPVWWHPPTPRAPGGEGFWVISRHADLLRVVRDPAGFSSETGPGRTGGGTTLEPFRFDVRRDPNPQVAFGHGLHHCLGANLARREIRILFEELLPHLGEIELAGPVEWGRSNKHTALRHVPIRWGRARRPAAVRAR